MSVPSGDLAVLLLKLLLGTLAFAWILWTVRDVNPRAVGMTLTFPTLNGVVLLSVTDKIVSEMVLGIFPLMLFNGFLPMIFLALRQRLGGRQWPALLACLLLWAALASLLEWPAVWPYRRALAFVAAALVVAGAAWAFWRLRRSGMPLPPQPVHSGRAAEFLRERTPRIFWFFVSLLIVSLVAYQWSDAHSLVGRLSALPLVPLFVLHWAVNERRIDLSDLRISALIGPLAAGAFLIVFTVSLGLIRSDDGVLHPLYWPLGLAILLVEWELTRRLILALSRLTYRG
jgi:small-conductance mechanosensitive channel